MQRKFHEQSLVEFLDALSAKTPTPGGGSAAAYLGATGISLGIMVCRFTTGEKFKAHAAEIDTAVNGLVNLRHQIVPLIDEDAAAYDRVSEALALPKENEAQKTIRKAKLQEALRGAMEIPFRTMDICHRALQILQRHAPQLNARLASDLAAGALSLGSALEAAWLNVVINAAAIKDDAKGVEIQKAAEKIRIEAGDLTSSILSIVNNVI